MHLTVDNLSKQFGRRVLFRGISFTLAGGETLAVTGANGSGKSTLIRMLAGVLTPTKGTVILAVDGASIAPEAHPFHMGLVAPYLNVYDGFSARENLRFLARVRHLPDAAARIETVLEQVGLAPRADDLVGAYSSGMKQRIRFAAALLADPPVLLLDEPTSNLDTAGVGMVAQVLRAQQQAGRLLVVATNEAAEAARCDRQIRIEDFRPAF
jgi:heme exporter protein A